MVLEPTNLLTLDRSRFRAFYQLVPGISQVFTAARAAYTMINSMTDDRISSKKRQRASALAKAMAAAAKEASDSPTAHSPTAAEAMSMLDEEDDKETEPEFDQLPVSLPPLKGKQAAVEVLENEFERHRRQMSASPSMRSESPRMNSPGGFASPSATRPARASR